MLGTSLTLRPALTIALGAASLILGSCANPYYGDPGYAYGSGGYAYGSGGYAYGSGGYAYGSGGPRPAYYDSYYGYGYDYGSPRFTSITFISTGDPRWGYDPQVRAYYDFRRRAYYDPYLYAYYPAGYRPVAVYRAPHPHHWRPGYSVIAPPTRVTTVTLRDLDRHNAYRRSSYSWAREVEQAPPPRRHDGNLPPGQVPGHSNRPFDPRFSTGMPATPAGSSASSYQRHYQSPQPVTARQPLPAATANIPGRGNQAKSKPSPAHSNRGDARSAEAIEAARENGAPARGWGNLR